ncbi:oxygenase MpaB family protein [Cytophagales bacterium LB-30]|uniref:Oxygenase MpaB family protein n=1 Tax=Shiella aurantiaca TaxID=3058365 RepID=A0ABT8F0X0_9BACT|nr:oxygenase MpaB family protein [Shiella aurantiaca]MDN4163949.1 oxygenase MpaB family protein [Shiella aurantiaca]
MLKEYFVAPDSIVRQIWGKSDTVLFIFAGASAEFALNKAVDWLYFTGRLPKDPLGRLFSTVSYAQAIVFSEQKTALQAIGAMAHMHAKVEQARGTSIPDWAYRDVLFMLIDYSIRAYEVLERKLEREEKEEVFQIFWRLGFYMGLKDLPANYGIWEKSRTEHLQNNLQYSPFTEDLFGQYRKHLGDFRYALLLEVQRLIVAPHVGQLLGHGSFTWADSLLPLYRFSKWVHLDGFLKALLLPVRYKREIRSLDRP